MKAPSNAFVEALYEEHADLLRELQELEKAVAASSREGPGELSRRLENIQTHLSDHFRFEEAEGYMAPVLKEEPRFAPAVEKLLAEHGQLAQTLNAILQDVYRARGVQDVPRERIRVWVGQVRHHESRENSLVQEVYYSSGATGD
jgi:hemerythrin-like domain-containing protein